MKVRVAVLMEEERSTLGKHQIIQSLLYSLILAAWSTARKMLVQGEIWWIWCSKAGVSEPVSNFISHLFSDPWISGPACFSQGHVFDRLEQIQNKQHWCSPLVTHYWFSISCLVRLCQHLSQGARNLVSHFCCEEGNRHLRRTDLWKREG